MIDSTSPTDIIAKEDDEENVPNGGIIFGLVSNAYKLIINFEWVEKHLLPVAFIIDE